MRFTDIDINFDVRYEGHQNCPKILSMNILRVFSDHHMWRQNWHQYLWTSLCQFIFFVNLLHSPGVWFCDIWHLFHNLTSFDILAHYLNHLSSSLARHQGVHVTSCAPYPCALLPHCPCDPLPMWPIPLVPHTPVPHTYCPCTPLPMWPMSPYPLYPIPPVPHTPSGPHCPYAPYPHTRLPLCPYCLCAPYPCTPLPLWASLAMCPTPPVPHFSLCPHCA